MVIDTTAPALELAAAIRARELSPVELVDACLARIDEADPELNAFVWRNDDEVREAARRAADAAAGGGELAPFHGVPIPVKDLTTVAGWPATYGSNGAAAAPAGESALVVEALRRAGFLLMGRTNTPELGPLTATENTRYGITRNPWDPSRTPGGSSGGAAAAVAAGMAPVAQGSDGGGSIRIPSSCCGLVGLKPSRGRVPTLVQMWEGAAVDGVLTRTVADSAAILDAIAGPDPLGWYNAPRPERSFAEDAGSPAGRGRLRIGLLDTAPLGLPVDPACVDAVHAAGELFERLGHDVEPTSFVPITEEAVPRFLVLIGGSFANYPLADWDAVEPHNAASRRRAQETDTLAYVAASEYLQRMSRGLVAHWGRDFDVLLTPTMACEPPEAGAILTAAHADPESPPLDVLRMVAFTLFANVTGQPGISLPLHETAAGLPIGVQLVGRPWDEVTLLRLAAQAEAAVPWAQRRPGAVTT